MEGTLFGCHGKTTRTTAGWLLKKPPVGESRTNSRPTKCKPICPPLQKMMQHMFVCCCLTGKMGSSMENQGKHRVNIKTVRLALKGPSEALLGSLKVWLSGAKAEMQAWASGLPERQVTKGPETGFYGGGSQNSTRQTPAHVISGISPFAHFSRKQSTMPRLAKPPLAPRPVIDLTATPGTSMPHTSRPLRLCEGVGPIEV